MAEAVALCYVIVVIFVFFSVDVPVFVLSEDIHTCGVCHKHYVDVLSFLHHKLERMYRFHVFHVLISIVGSVYYTKNVINNLC